VATDGEEGAGSGGGGPAAPPAVYGCAAAWGRMRLGFTTLTAAFYMPPAGLSGLRAEDGPSKRAGLPANQARRPHRPFWASMRERPLGQVGGPAC
jgi:hypothetical protein